jgi:hypothetical protein
MKRAIASSRVPLTSLRCAQFAVMLSVFTLTVIGLLVSPSVAFQGGSGRPGGARPKGSPDPGATKETSPKSKKRPKKEKEKEPEKDKEPAEVEKATSDESKRLKDLKSEQKLPQLLEMTVPTVAELNRRPVDWLVLEGNNKVNPEVLVVKPVFPRPDTLRKMSDAFDELRKRPRPTNPDEREKWETQKADLQKLLVSLPDDASGQIYEIPTGKINHIVYHEDLTIRRAGLLADEKKFRDALELLYPLERTAPKWKGLEDLSRHMLLSEAEATLRGGDYLAGLMSLIELHSRDPAYPGIHTRLGEVTDKLIESARQAHDDREARHYLARLARIEPDHETVQKWRRDLQSDAQTLIASALKAAGEGHYGEAAATIDRAARVWPRANGLADVHRKICERYQWISVGAMTLPGNDRGLPWPTLADQRATRLEQFDLFEVDRVDDATHYRSRLLEEWEPTDLGRRAYFTLRRTHATWESRRDLPAASLMSTMRTLIDPASPAYDERFASYVDGVQLRSPLELEIRFSRAPPRMEPLFRFPITGAGGAQSPTGGLGHSGTGPILSRRFERSTPSHDAIVFRRAFPQPEGLDQYRLAEVDEHRYDSPQHEIQALLRGDISMLLDLPPWAIGSLRKDTRFFVLDYAIPTTHVLQFNPNSQALKSRELRLALSYALDVQRILSQRILRSADSSGGRLSTAPFATTSYAYNGLLTRREFSASMGVSLHAAAVKRLQSIRPLRLVCEHDPEAESAAAEILSQWKRVGIAAEIVQPESLAGDPQSVRRPLDWDIAYRKLRMEEPLVEIWPFLTVNSGARLESVRSAPDWLRIELLDLDRAPDWKSAVSRLQTLHAHLYAEVAYIPLWEVDDAIVLRKNVRDFPPFKFVTPYQDVERWIVQSWFPEDEP